MKHKSVIIIVFIAFAGIGYFLLSKGGKEKNIGTPQLERYAAAEGKVEILPGYEVEISSELEGRIESFSVKEGDAVKKGELIAMLANSDIKAKLRESEAELAVARARLRETASGAREEEIKEAAAALESAKVTMEYEKTSHARHGKLYNKGYIPHEMLDEKEKNFKVAVSNVKRAEETKTLLEKGPKAETLRLREEEVRKAGISVEYYQKLLDKTYITSPITGKLIRKYLQQGEGVSKDKALAAVADISRLRINAEVDETDIGMVSVGGSAEIKSDTFADKVFTGKVGEISDYAGIRKVKPNDQAKNLDMKVVQVKVTLGENTGLKPGMTVDVKIMPGR